MGKRGTELGRNYVLYISSCCPIPFYYPAQQMDMVLFVWSTLGTLEILNSREDTIRGACSLLFLPKDR